MDAQLILDAVAELVREQTVSLMKDVESLKQIVGEVVNRQGEMRDAFRDFQHKTDHGLTILTMNLQKRCDEIDASVQQVRESAKHDVEQSVELVNTLMDDVDTSIDEIRLDLNNSVHLFGAERSAIEERFDTIEKTVGYIERLTQEDKSCEETRLMVGLVSDRMDALEKKIVDSDVHGRLADLDLKLSANAVAMDVLETAVEQIEKSIEHIGKSEIADVKNTFGNVADRIEALEKREPVDAELRKEIAALAAKVEKAPDDALRLLLDHYHGAEEWKRGGAGYQKFAVVRHRGALWQTLTETTQEPGNGETWVLLADGLSHFQTAVEPDGKFRLISRMASGAVLEADYQLPTIRFKGVYDQKVEYRQYDAMVKDGHTFLALRDNPGDVGVEKGGWMTIGYRGKAGRRGPTLEEVAADIKPDLVRELSAELPGLVAVAIDAATEPMESTDK